MRFHPTTLTPLFTLTFLESSMSIKSTTPLSSVVLAVALLGGGAAFAQEATPDTWMQATSVKTSQQVRDELVKARKDGTTRAWSAGYMEPMRSTLSRAQVHAQVIAARDSGELQEVNAEAFAFGQKPRAAATLLANR
jgi:hypothetical protein